MKRVSIVAGLAFMLCGAVSLSVLAQTDSSQAESTTIPAGTRIELAVTAPVWARTAKPGDALYKQVDFPVIVGKSVAIPAGTYVQGTIQSITRPSRFRSRAEIQALFTSIIFANGYAAQLPPLFASANEPAPAPLAATLMKLTIDVNTVNDLLLDNGAQFDITLAAPLSLDPKQLAAAMVRTHSFDPGQFRSATQCRPTPGIPGTPGTPDTVIPGSPGTPDTTVPGGPGMPDIVIPGIPPSPPTVIPGTSGTSGFAGTSCPHPPVVISSVPIRPGAQTPMSANNH